MKIYLNFSTLNNITEAYQKAFVSNQRLGHSDRTLDSVRVFTDHMNSKDDDIKCGRQKGKLSLTHRETRRRISKLEPNGHWLFWIPVVGGYQWFD